MQYDTLGRMITRKEPEGTTTWTYDTQPKGIGKLASITAPGVAYKITIVHFPKLPLITLSKK